MRKLSLLSCLILLAAALPAAAMDADELIAKAIEAQGGRDALEAVQTSQADGKVIAQGMELPFAMKAMRPNKLRIDVSVMGMEIVQAFDGQDGWSINPMTGSSDPQPMGDLEAKAFRLQADMDGFLLDWQDRGYTVEYLGTADVEGTETHHLRLDTHDDLVLDMYFDSEYFLLIKTTSTMLFEGNEIVSDTYTSDYKEVGDLILAHAIETRMNGMTQNQIVIDSIIQNGEVDEALFAMPAVAEKPAAAEKPE